MKIKRVIGTVIVGLALAATPAWANGKGKDGDHGDKDKPGHEQPKDGPNTPEGPKGPQGPSSDGPNVDPCNADKQECQGK